MISEAANPFEVLDLAELRKRTSIKWAAYPSDVLPLWVAEMDVPLAQPIAAALHEAVDIGDTGYAHGPRYIDAIAEFARRNWDFGHVSQENSTVVPDVMLGIVEILRVITDAGAAVVVNAPVYPPFHAFVLHSDRRLIEARLTEAGRIDFDELDRAFAEATSGGRRAVFIMSNPHNPTGVVHTRDELAQVAALACQRGVRVISDEIHAPLMLAGTKFTPWLSVDGAESGFSVTSASKAWNLAGLKAAVATAGAEAADDIASIPEEVEHGVSGFGVIAHTAAFNDGQAWLDAALAGLTANRDLLVELLAEHLPTVSWNPPEGTYLAWLDCRSLGLHGADIPAGEGVVSDVAGPTKFFLDEARVALSSGHVFGTGGAGHVRLNFATSQTILREAVSRMGEAVKNL